VLEKKKLILDLGNTLVVEVQKGILLYSCHIVRKFLNIDTEHNKYTTKSKCGGETPVMLISTALLLDSNIRIMYVLRQNCRAAGWWRVKEINSFFVVGHCSIKKMLVIKANSWLCILATLKIRL
jgi:hypothetical protein